MATEYAGQYGPEPVMYPTSGRAIPNLPIRVENLDGTLASLWLEKSRTVPASNPRLTDSIGNLMFYADPGVYNLAFENGDVQIVVQKHPAEPAFSEDDREALAEEIMETDTSFADIYLTARS